jgi:F-type H+-transporting ATPase subunit delta
MSNGTISVRYARALLEFTIENQSADRVYAEMKSLRDVLQRVPKLKATICDPTLAAGIKLSVLNTAITNGENNISESTERFLKLVLEHHREEILFFMAVSYISMYREKNGILFTRLTTATPIDEQTVKRFEDIVHKSVNGSIEWERSVYPEIEGGFILQIDDRRLDASIATQISKIKKELIDKNKRII